jgi:hypothetical protein
MKRRGKDVRLRDFDEGLLYEMIAEAKVENKSKNQDSAKCKSLTGNTCAQLFTDGKGFIHILPMTSKSEAGHMLDRHCQEVGIPNKLIYDGASEQVGKDTKFQRSIRHYRIDGREIEPFTPEQNAAEKSVRIIKSRWKWLMVRKRVPKRLWDMAMVWVAQIYSRTASVNDGRTGMERITGDTCDISEWVDFSFYDLCWYWGHPDDDSNPKIGRWLGVSHRVGSAMCYWVLTHNAKILSRTTVQHVTATEASKDEIQAQIRDYHCSLDNLLGNEAYVTDLDGFDAFINDDVPGEPNAMEDWRLPARGLEEPPLWDEVPDIDDIIDQTTPESAADTYHKYVGAEVCLPDASGERKMAKVIKRLKTGNNNSDARNPWMDTSTYEVEFPDGHVEELDANIIAENMYSLVDSEGRHHQVLSEIADHRKSHAAIPIENGFYRTRSGNRHPKKTTRGWDLLVEWKDGSSSWVPLKELKLSNPVELAEYAIANGIEHEPAFHWWVKHVLRRRDRIIAKVKTKYWRTTHKFGIRIPKTVEEALELDRTNGNDFWAKAIEKEMSKVRVAFEKLNVSVDEMRQGKFKPGYQEIKCHMIFDVKMDGNFTRKARLVAGGHMTEAPASITYSSVVSRDSVRIAFMLAALNGLDVFAADVGNAYLNAPCREKIWTVAGLEFGSDAGNVMLVVRALYGLKSSGAAWAAMLSQTLSELGYSPSRADRNVWLKRASKPDGFEYYEMILVYVDDILHISHDTKPAINALMKLYLIRKESMGPPNRYLGANIDKIQTEDGQVMWSTTCVDYCKGAIGNVEAMLQQDGMNPLKTYGDGKRPYPSTYRPEIDVTKELDDESTQRFQQWIGVLRWAIELGRIDIMTEVSNLSCHLCMPREGHLDAVYRIFRYLQKNLTKNPGRIAFDPRMVNTQQECEDSGSHVHWEEFYPGAKEPIPPDMPEPLGNPVEVSAYVDANHAGNLLNRRSHTGILIYVNNAPIIWYSKRQNTVESSSFGSEFVALRVATEMIESLRYKLRMFGVPIIGPAVVYCDNKSVVTNASVPVSVLNKRHNAICYHKVREAQAAGTIKVMWIPGTSNLADLFTKTTLPGNVKNDIVETIFNNKAYVLERESDSNREA